MEIKLQELTDFHCSILAIDLYYPHSTEKITNKMIEYDRTVTPKVDVNEARRDTILSPVTSQ